MADNVSSPVTGKTFATKDIGGAHHPKKILTDYTGAEVLGQVTASPTANTVLDRLKALLTGIVLAAGTNIIGKVGIDQTTPGTTNGVQVNAALPAGTNNIGDVDVLTLPALAAGTNNIGDVDVLTLPALPAGSNLIGKVSLTDITDAEYETVAASQTAQVLGPTGATGDYLQGLLVVPANTSPGNVIILDNATSITVFAGGASSVSNLVPFFIPLGIKSVSGAWKVTTGADVSVIGVGNFT